MEGGPIQSLETYSSSLTSFSIRSTTASERSIYSVWFSYPLTLFSIPAKWPFKIRGVFNRTPLSEWQARKSFHLHRKDEVFRFAETHYELFLGNSFHSIDYSNIEAIVEDKKHNFLFINKNSAHVLNKEKFVVGSADYFRAFISGKTGVTIKTV